MTQAFNLSLLANNVNTSGKLDASTGLVNATPVANGGTGSTSLTANNVLLGNGTSALQVVAPGTSGNVLTSNGTTWQSSVPISSKFYRYRYLTSGTTYTKPSDVIALYVFVSGSTAGTGVQYYSNNPYSGSGGAGYSELYIASPSASYSYTIGAGGAGTTGGSTTFGGIITVTGATTTTGGIASGGTFNANGGTAPAIAYGGLAGGGGGGGSRAGNGGNGASAYGHGYGGGTGGNNATSTSNGIAATSVAAGAISLPFGQIKQSFLAGATSGANGYCYFDGVNPGIPNPILGGWGGEAGGLSSCYCGGIIPASPGSDGRILLVEYCQG